LEADLATATALRERVSHFDSARATKSTAETAKVPSQEARYSSGTASQVPFCFISRNFWAQKQSEIV